MVPMARRPPRVGRDVFKHISRQQLVGMGGEMLGRREQVGSIRIRNYQRVGVAEVLVRRTTGVFVRRPLEAISTRMIEQRL